MHLLKINEKLLYFKAETNFKINQTSKRGQRTLFAFPYSKSYWVSNSVSYWVSNSVRLSAHAYVWVALNTYVLDRPFSCIDRRNSCIPFSVDGTVKPLWHMMVLNVYMICFYPCSKVWNYTKFQNKPQSVLLELRETCQTSSGICHK